ncbi:hypothetical protein A2707_01570 [Candidatus Saccharibacteria bacterium RIFCSPHIGHO2_01_FULL_45_15]|nr:MAG: hypothetical protein A2707_01570 [Candidatus Saccharibacteria bacterium RIFCSPHIGHO2_01_FULL_45_15]OGL27968.1 MAG: hypothetical protein A3C39_02665 [Candidatus Saccharibacteria bacterium RIFCSPHIGHO2_02_FULL_46_12]OGL31726.1 MAG: hypothetical protein A3E76_01275 [Candidatus Saccharibacteria bacterium RIFCSPHIGHO2_12_FULL_44_22]
MKTFFKILVFVLLTIYVLFYGFISGAFGGSGIAGYRANIGDYIIVYGLFIFYGVLFVRFLYRNRNRK